MKHMVEEAMIKILSDYNTTRQQARAAVTTYCIIAKIEVDTAEWDKLIGRIYEHYNSWFESIEGMDAYFAQDLV